MTAKILRGLSLPFLTLLFMGTTCNGPSPTGSIFTLTVSKSGDGSGTVTSRPPGIACGNDCSQDYPVGTSVTLMATPDSSSVFTSWRGCDSTDGNLCEVSMTNARTVTADFAISDGNGAGVWDNATWDNATWGP